MIDCGGGLMPATTFFCFVLEQVTTANEEVTTINDFPTVSSCCHGPNEMTYKSLLMGADTK